MATNKLMEAAADILAGSKKSATGMPSQKAEAEVVDLGGPTNQNSKPMDDSAKIDAAKAIKGKAAAPTTKPSDASSKMEEIETEEEIIAEKMHDDEKKEEMKKKMKEDVDALFADDSTISEEFKSKVSTIFEARVADRVSQIEEETEAKYAGMLEEAVESIRADLTEKVDDYLSYVVEQWMKDNEIAIESGLRSELTEDFIAGMRNLFAEHYIDVPAEKVDLVDELAGKVEELESKLNEEIERGISYAKALVESRKNELSREVCDGLTTTQAEKIKSLAEGVEFSTEEEYTNKLETIRENYFPSGIKKANEQQLHEIVEDAGEQKVINDPFVAAVSNAISKTKF
jgi:membrane-associated HD superfamily phosphohydrolase